MGYIIATVIIIISLWIAIDKISENMAIRFTCLMLKMDYSEAKRNYKEYKKAKRGK